MNLIIIVIFCTFALVHTNEYRKLDLNQNWVMTLLEGPAEADKLRGKTFETSLPTNVHLDLEKGGAITNPLLENNYPQVKWVS